MKKLLIVLLILILTLTGCGQMMTREQIIEYNNNQPSYTFLNVEAEITDIDMRYGFAVNPRWSWDISVKYNDLTFDENGFASGAFNRPSFADKKVGDIVTV